MYVCTSRRILLMMKNTLNAIRLTYKTSIRFEFFSSVEELLPVVHCRAEKNAGKSNERRNMQKRHVTQKARCVRLVHGDHISRVVRGKTQGIVGPRARTQERRHARTHTYMYDPMTSPRFLMTISRVTDARTKKTRYRMEDGVLLRDNPAC